MHTVEEVKALLRQLLGQPERKSDSQVENIIRLIDEYCEKLRANFRDEVASNEHIYRIEAWAGGFRNSLNELEQSQFAARWLQRRVSKKFEEEMDAAEKADYECHVYFYKNSIIRIFSVLDKLGYFMNELLLLRTESVKPRYSFFTVLRQMKKVRHLDDLSGALSEIKAKYKYPLNVLRHKRNTEIHYLNVEMLDDLKQTRKAFTKKNHVEDLAANMELLDEGCQMVYQTLETVFVICANRLPHGTSKAGTKNKK